MPDAEFAQKPAPRVVVLTGAGVSAESGLATFRDADGLWEGHRVEDVATPEAFDHQPGMVQDFYDARRAVLALVEPNPAHLALAQLEDIWATAYAWSPRTSTISTPGRARIACCICTAS